MIVQTLIVNVSRNTDGSFRVSLQGVADPSLIFQATLPASEAQNAYIGRAVNVTFQYA